MIDPDDVICECKRCGNEFTFNTRYSRNANKDFCPACLKDQKDAHDDMKFQQRRDGE